MNPLSPRDLLAELASHPPHEQAVAASYLAVIVFVAADLVAAGRREPDRRRTQRAEARTAVSMAAGAVAVGVAYTAVFAAVWSLVARGAPDPLVELWDRHPVAALVFAFVAWDLGGWIYHLIGHRTRVGWAAHSAHHTGREFNGSLALRQSWIPIHGLAHQPLLALSGVSLTTVLVCIAVSNALQAVQHCSAPLRLPRWVAAVLVTPDAHRHHHLVDGGAVNLGPVLTVWDRLAGTWQPGPVPPDARYGHRSTPGCSAWRAEWTGWAELVGGIRGRGRGAAPDPGGVHPVSPSWEPVGAS